MKQELHLLFLALCLLSACKPSKPSGVFSEGKMVKILVDYHLAQGMAEGSADPEKNRYINIQKVFQKHHVSEADFDSSMVYFSIHAEDMAKIYQIVNERIEANANLMGVETEKRNKFADMSEDGDTANIWSGEKVFTLKSQPTDNISTFCIKADSTFRKGDSFLWHFKTNFLVQDNTRELFAMLVIQYQNDSVSGISRMIRLDEETNLEIHPKTHQDTLNIKSLSGYLFMPIAHEEENVFRMVQASELALVRYHKETSLPNDTSSTEEIVEQKDIPEINETYDTLQIEHERLSPMEMRESQPKEKTIHIVKEKSIPLKNHTRRNINGSIRRQK